MRMSEDIGTTNEYPNRSAAERCSKVAYLRMKINSDRASVSIERFAVVLERYVQEEIPKRFSTKLAYLSYINNHIRPQWGEFPLAQVKPLAVCDWLKGIQDKKGHRPLASKTRGHIKGLMRHASIRTTLNTYGGGMMDSMRESHGRVVKQAMAR
jgi:integrase